MTIENPKSILQNRTDCIVYQAKLETSTEHRAGWIGGNAPVFFDDAQHLIHEHDGRLSYFFYLTLVHPFKPDQMIYIFVPADYDDYLEHNIYPDCSIKVIEHPISIESTEPTFTNPNLIKHDIEPGEVTSDNDNKSMESPFLIKVGGTPKLIQQEDYYMTDLQQEGFSFFFQVDEEGYPETVIAEDGSYLFGFGALYIYAKIENDEIGQPVAGFWQFS